MEYPKDDRWTTAPTFDNNAESAFVWPPPCGNDGIRLQGIRHVIEYPMKHGVATYESLCELHEMVLGHLAHPNVFACILPKTTNMLELQIDRDVPSLSDEAKYQVFTTRAADTVTKLFGKRGCFNIYADQNTIVIGIINVPSEIATSSFINEFSAQNGEPFFCLVDVAIRLHAILVSHDETTISIDMQIDRVTHGANILPLQ